MNNIFNFKFNGLLIFIFITSIILLPVTARACEPIIPMAMLYSGTTILGAVALKSAYGLLVAVAIKCLWFCWKSELDYFTASWYMIAANIYSTVPGLLLGAAFAAPIIIIILYPVLLIPGGNIKNYNAFKSFGRFGSAAILLVLIFLSGIIYALAMNVQDTSLIGYWILKIVYSIIAVSLSFIITIVCEDGIISYLHEKKTGEKKSFINPVIRANLVVFLVIMIIAAAATIPKRLNSPNFLIQIFKKVITEVHV